MTKYDYDLVQFRLHVDGHGNLTLFEISIAGLYNLSGYICDPDVELNENNQLLIIGFDMI